MAEDDKLVEDDTLVGYDKLVEDDKLADENLVTITATEKFSELTTSDIEIISNYSGMWHKTKLINGERLQVRKSHNCKKGDIVVVIDVTKKPWVKQLGTIINDESVKFGDTTDVVRRHFIHVRCKNNITIVNGRKYCDKCKQIILPRNIAYLSILTNDVFKNKSIVLGSMLVNNVGNKVLLMDAEYTRREEKVI